MDYNDRIKSIQDYLIEHDFDAFLILTRLNRIYLSGFTGSAGVVVITQKRAELYVDERYTIRAKRESPLPVRRISSLPLPARRIGGRGREGWKVAIEDKIALSEFNRLKQNHKGVKWVPTTNVVENLRAVKTAKEKNSIKKAQKIIDKIFTAVKKLPLADMSELELSQKMERLAVRFGAQCMAFESIVASGANAAAPHHLSSNQKIRKNNFLLLDFGVLVNGYHSDFTRTLFIGRPNKKQEKVYNTVLEAQAEAIDLIRDSARASAVDGAARGHIKRAGFGKYFTHNCGHGVGLEIHELPNFAPTSQDTLKTGMIVTVEPGIYLSGRGGVRIEDMILVREKPIMLSKSSKLLKDMIVK